MTRTDRLYALVEELRSAAPRPRTVAQLAARFEVSARTIQRDLQALMHSGVPLRAAAGRTGGWFVDPVMTLPPINFTAAEVTAIAVALAAAENTAPFSAAARSAMQKLTVAMAAGSTEPAREVARRIQVVPTPLADEILSTVERAIAERQVVWLHYGDAAGEQTERLVEPAGLLTARGSWYLIGWCRLRQAGRGFRLDRIRAARLTGESAPAHELADLAAVLPEETKPADVLDALTRPEQ